MYLALRLLYNRSAWPFLSIDGSDIDSPLPPPPRLPSLAPGPDPCSMEPTAYRTEDELVDVGALSRSRSAGGGAGGARSTTPSATPSNKGTPAIKRERSTAEIVSHVDPVAFNLAAASRR